MAVVEKSRAEQCFSPRCRLANDDSERHFRTQKQLQTRTLQPSRATTRLEVLVRKEVAQRPLQSSFELFSKRDDFV